MQDPLDVVVADMHAEHQRVLGAEAHVAVVVLTYMFIDAMAWSGLPATRSRVKQADFETWVERFLKSHPPTPYQYTGSDVYRARCAMLHTYSMQSVGATNRMFGYHDGSRHSFNPKKNANLVMISVEQLVDDFYKAVAQYVKVIRSRSDRHVVETRFEEMFQSLPFSGANANKK